VPDPIRVTLYNDAGCPWGYSANPALRTLEWRYGAQLEWRLVLIGLTDLAQEYVDRGYTPLRSAEGYARRFRRFGMPLAPNLRSRIVGTGRSCRAVVAVRLRGETTLPFGRATSGRWTDLGVPSFELLHRVDVILAFTEFLFIGIDFEIVI